jgi:hypothetical protein
MALLAGAVTPRMASTVAGPPVSWGPIAAHDDMDELAAALTALALNPAPRVAHLHTLARIARRKWARIRQGLLTLAVAGGLLLALALGTAL